MGVSIGRRHGSVHRSLDYRLNIQMAAASEKEKVMNVLAFRLLFYFAF
jgi:hypothetical protein